MRYNFCVITSVLVILLYFRDNSLIFLIMASLLIKILGWNKNNFLDVNKILKIIFWYLLHFLPPFKYSFSQCKICISLHTSLLLFRCVNVNDSSNKELCKPSRVSGIFCPPINDYLSPLQSGAHWIAWNFCSFNIIHSCF